MSKLITKINIFLFMLWIEIIIFVISLITSSYLFMFLWNIFFYKKNFNFYQSIKIGLLLLILCAVQYIYKTMILKITKINAKLIITIVNASFFSLFFIYKIIKTLTIGKYDLIYPAIFITLTLPFYEDMIDIYTKFKKKHHKSYNHN